MYCISQMNPELFRLMIHHHDVARVDDAGTIWLTAGIAHWVSALADYFKEIGLLLHQSSTALPRQDTTIDRDNVRLYSLGAPGKTWDRIPRMRRIRQVCQQAGARADGLLIRGITPRQHTVWNHTSVPHKAFLLVGSLTARSSVQFTPFGLYAAIISKHRKQEFREIASHNTLLMVNSPAYVAEIDHLYGFQAHFVPTNTIRKAEFAPFQVRSLSNPVRLLYCGRLDYQKGLQELFQATSILLQSGLDCELEIMALKKEPVYTQLRTIAEDFGLADIVHWHDYVPYGLKLFQIYQSADIFILPTYTEGFPRVLWEAAANCCPTITTTVGGIPALWENERHGLLVPPKNVAALVNAIQRLLYDHPLRQHLISQAYKHALDYTVENCSEKMAIVLSRNWS